MTCRRKGAGTERVLAASVMPGNRQPPAYFMLGRTIPRRMIFWQAMKTIAVGIDTTTKPAITAQGWSPNYWLIWYIHTASVQRLCF